MSSARETPMFVALLRAINVGGSNKLPMNELSHMFVEAGCSDVATYIQSGNVVFRASPALAQRVPQLIKTRIQERFGYQVPVVQRSAQELCLIAASNPFVTANVDTHKLHVAFLAQLPKADRTSALDPSRSFPDAFELRGREIYLHLPLGVAKTKLTNAYFDARLATTSTVRNWRTVLKLVEMTKG